MDLVAGVHRDDNMTSRPFAQKTSRLADAGIRTGNSKVPSQRSEYAQESARHKSEHGLFGAYHS
jgi:hypothetical protein